MKLKGKVTPDSILRHDVDYCAKTARTYDDFFRYMEYSGYVFTRDESYKHISVITEGWDKPLRLDSLGNGYPIEAIKDKIGEWHNIQDAPPPARYIERPLQKTGYEMKRLIPEKTKIKTKGKAYER